FDIERVSPERADGVARLKDVIVRAVVRHDDGRAGERRLVVTLEKRGDAAGANVLYGGWTVTAVRDAEPSRVAPRSSSPTRRPPLASAPRPPARRPSPLRSRGWWRRLSRSA